MAASRIICGGGIYNSGTMTLDQVIVNNNNAAFSGRGTNPPSGGGISNTGTMIIIAGTVQSNMGFWSAGGIYNTGMLTITGSMILNNQPATLVTLAGLAAELSMVEQCDSGQHHQRKHSARGRSSGW